MEFIQTEKVEVAVPTQIHGKTIQRLTLIAKHSSQLLLSSQAATFVYNTQSKVLKQAARCPADLDSDLFDKDQIALVSTQRTILGLIDLSTNKKTAINFPESNKIRLIGRYNFRLFVFSKRLLQIFDLTTHKEVGAPGVELSNYGIPGARTSVMCQLLKNTFFCVENIEDKDARIRLFQVGETPGNLPELDETGQKINLAKIGVQVVFDDFVKNLGKCFFKLAQVPQPGLMERIGAQFSVFKPGRGLPVRVIRANYNLVKLNTIQCVCFFENEYRLIELELGCKSFREFPLPMISKICQFEQNFALMVKMVDCDDFEAQTEGDGIQGGPQMPGNRSGVAWKTELRYIVFDLKNHEKHILKDSEYINRYKTPKNVEFARNGGLVYQIDLPTAFFKEFNTAPEKLKIGLLEVTGTSSESEAPGDDKHVSYSEMSSFSFEANLSQYLKIDPEDAQKIQKRLISVAASNPLSNIIEGIESNTLEIARTDNPRFDQILEILEQKLSKMDSKGKEETTETLLNRLYSASEELLYNLLNNLKIESRETRVLNLIDILASKNTLHTQPTLSHLKNPFTEADTLLKHLKSLKVKFERISLPRLLNKDFGELLEYGKQQRDTELIGYVLRELSDEGNRVDLFRILVMYLAGDWVEDQFFYEWMEVMHGNIVNSAGGSGSRGAQNGENLQIFEKLGEIYIEVIERVEVSCQLELMSQLLYMTQFWQLFDSVQSKRLKNSKNPPEKKIEKSGHYYTKLRLKYFFMDRFSLGDTSSNLANDNKQFLVENLCLILSSSSDPTSTLLEIEHEIDFVKEDTDSVLSLYASEFYSVFEKMENIKKGLIDYMVNLGGFDLLCRFHLPSLDLTDAEITDLILVDINEENFGAMKDLAKNTQNLDNLATLCEIFKAMGALGVDFGLRGLLSMRSVARLVRLAISNLIQKEVNEYAFYYKDVAYNLKAKDGKDIKNIFKFLVVLRDDLLAFRAFFIDLVKERAKAFKLGNGVRERGLEGEEEAEGSNLNSSGGYGDESGVERKIRFYGDFYKILSKDRGLGVGGGGTGSGAGLDIVVMFVEELFRENKASQVFGILRGLNAEDEDNAFEYESIENTILAQALNQVLNTSNQAKNEQNENTDNTGKNEDTGGSEATQSPSKYSYKLPNSSYLFSMAKSIAKSTFTHSDQNADPTSLIRWIWWKSARVEGLRCLIRLKALLNTLKIEFKKSEIFEENFQLRIIHKIWDTYQNSAPEDPIHTSNLRLIEVYTLALKFKKFFVDYQETRKNDSQAFYGIGKLNERFLGDNLRLLERFEKVDVFKIEEFVNFLKIEMVEDMVAKGKDEELRTLLKTLSDKNQKDVIVWIFKKLTKTAENEKSKKYQNLAFLSVKDVKEITGVKKGGSRDEILDYFLLSFNDDVNSIQKYLSREEAGEGVLKAVEAKLGDSRFMNEVLLSDLGLVETAGEHFYDTVVKSRIIEALEVLGRRQKENRVLRESLGGDEGVGGAEGVDGAVCLPERVFHGLQLFLKYSTVESKRAVQYLAWTLRLAQPDVKSDQNDGKSPENDQKEKNSKNSISVYEAILELVIDLKLHLVFKKEKYSTILFDQFSKYLDKRVIAENDKYSDFKASKDKILDSESLFILKILEEQTEEKNYDILNLKMFKNLSEPSSDKKSRKALDQVIESLSDLGFGKLVYEIIQNRRNSAKIGCVDYLRTAYAKRASGRREQEIEDSDDPLDQLLTENLKQRWQGDVFRQFHLKKVISGSGENMTNLGTIYDLDEATMQPDDGKMTAVGEGLAKNLKKNLGSVIPFLTYSLKNEEFSEANQSSIDQVIKSLRQRVKQVSSTT